MDRWDGELAEGRAGGVGPLGADGWGWQGVRELGGDPGARSFEVIRIDAEENTLGAPGVVGPAAQRQPWR